MEIFALVLVLGLILAILFGIPFGLAWLIYQWMKKHHIPYYIRWTAVIPALILLYFMGSFFFPDEHDYKMDYWDITTIKFPIDGQFIYKDSTMTPNQHSFNFGIKANRSNYESVWDVLYRRGFNYDSTVVSPSYIKDYMQKNNLKTFQKLRLSRYPHFNYYVEFLSDNSSIFFRKIPK